jgi:hypothetical protein
MAESLKDKIVHAVTAATGSNATVVIDEVDGGRYAGYVLWPGFANSSPSERQDRIWERLDAELSKVERTRISFIIADTAEEYESIRQASHDGA